MLSLQVKVGKWILEERAFCIVCEDKQVELSPTAFRLLQLFVSHGDKVISMSTIKEQVWHTEFTTDNLVYQTIRNLRLALEDGTEQTYIKTIPRSGYQLIAPIVKQNDELVQAVAEPIEGISNKYSKLLLTVFIGVTMAVVLASIIFIYFIKPQSTDSVHIPDLVVINGFYQTKSDSFNQLVSQLSSALHIESVQRAEHASMREAINALGSGTKIVIEHIPDKNALLAMVFMGLPSRLIHIEMQALGKNDRELISNIVSRVKTPMLKQGNSGIAELVNASKELKALVALSNSEQLKTAIQSLHNDIELNSFNEQQKVAKRAFVDMLLAFYKIEHFDNERLLSGVNYLLARYHQSNYAIISAALYLANQGNAHFAFQLLERLEQDHFVTFIQGLIHLELNEDPRALKHFEKVYKHEQSFEDNAYFYFYELFYSERESQLDAYRSDLERSNYASNGIHYVFFNWYLKHGQFEQAMSLLLSMKERLQCSDDMTRSLAMLNSALRNTQWSERWLQKLDGLNARDWGIPWLIFSNYVMQGKLASYSNWYNDYVSNVLASHSLFEPVFLNAMTQLALEDKQQAMQSLAFMTSASGSFSQDPVIDVAKAIVNVRLAPANPDERVSLLSQYEDSALALKGDEIALPEFVMASYFTLYGDVGKAEQALILGCIKSPAMCNAWQFFPLLQGAASTLNVERALQHANDLIKSSQPKLIELNKQLYDICQ